MKNLIFVIFLCFFYFKASSTFTVNCNYRSIDYSQRVRLVYECLTTNIPATSGNRVTAITGSHNSGKTSNDVESICIEGNYTLTFVPQGFSNFYPNIKAYVINFAAIETFHGDEFNEFSKLQFLQVYNSKLTTISSRIFEKTPKMTFVNFNWNLLERVGRDLFTPLNVSQLLFIAFGSNRCISRSEHNGNQTAINLIISELRQSCPFDDEEQVITTTTALTTTTTEESLTCSEKKIEDLVCDLKDEMEKVQESLATENGRIDKIELKLQSKNEKIEKLENELRQELQLKDEKMEEMRSDFVVLQSRVMWLEGEFLRSSTYPCACK